MATETTSHIAVRTFRPGVDKAVDRTRKRGRRRWTHRDRGAQWHWTGPRSVAERIESCVRVRVRSLEHTHAPNNKTQQWGKRICEGVKLQRVAENKPVPVVSNPGTISNLSYHRSVRFIIRMPARTYRDTIAQREISRKLDAHSFAVVLYALALSHLPTKSRLANARPMLDTPSPHARTQPPNSQIAA